MNILVVDDESVIREGLARILEGDSFTVDAAKNGHAAIELLQQKQFELIITDLKMPGMSGFEVLNAVKILQPDTPVIMITGFATVETAVEAMKNGTVDYIVKPFTPEQILEKVHLALEQKKTSVEDIVVKKEIDCHHGFDEFVGESREMQKVYRRIIQVASTDSTVLITGESGTGKELAARAIHKHSSRRDQPFVAVDCTALAENLLESELFGHVKGSFTGAVQTKMGLLMVADGGTLFLDEVSNISLATQAKLLRVLQERQVTPIGGTQPVSFNIHLVAATNRNLKTMVAEGKFREDLFFRLNIIPLELPPLRERKGDIPLLIRHFMNKFVEEVGKDLRGISPEAMQFLENYSYPGNVRELVNTIERAVVLCEGDVIQKENLELGEPAEAPGTGFDGFVPTSAEALKEMKRHIRDRSVENVEKAFVIQALKRNNWNISRAAEETGMLRPNFQTMLKRLGISVKDYFGR
ncbi:sigma-54-dependent transcriptional regulator [Geomonas subterranea]|uniref:Sigma-54 dependent transcriptional regulator n=1 Tax=Geomonas subterranea TaxID=2847989 RepID=A0ABX8LCB8_9BACT|nr:MULTISPECIES: sigma-54 dependent transcriptional regulator [Geomonas]QXE89338.1 sigma-54 dependent transcriptional regulator [Geomonas subterranea]QXM08547.1 sigma-54 dependent transcriptional regulator [Geomonas subterranea]